MGIKHKIRKLFWRIGIDFTRYNAELSPSLRRKKLISNYSINKILDIGANAGQFATEMRDDLGFTGQIHSFEPLGAVFPILKKLADSDPDWTAYHYALGDENTEQKINISDNTQSSSLLEMLPAHLDAAPESRYTGNEIITVKTLDSIFDDIYRPGDNIYMKIDTQGYESKVIKGAINTLDRIGTIQLEMALTPLYRNEELFIDMYQSMVRYGYELVSIETGYVNENTGQLLQLDGIFHRQPG
jgi:FkbM family methyltransferase